MQRAYDAERFDMARTRCRVVQADFRKSPKALPAFTYTDLPGSGLVQFHVTNDTDATLTAVRFSCRQSPGVRVTFGTKPMFQQALDYEIAPGAAFDLVSQRMFTAISGCLVYSVDIK